jgi:UDP-2-acetamido-3-amino-2,3-dideoxy-glucuronate N-acetyltransferase
MNVALIGKGHWGEIYIKTLLKMKNVNLTTYTHNYKEALDNKNIECVIIATPADTHFQIIKDSLLARKHVLVEKPFVTDSNKIGELHEILDKTDLILRVGHVYLYHDGILWLKKLIDDGSLGKIESIYSKRMSVSKYPNALWEMGTHDIYIFDYLFDKFIPKENKIMGDTTHCIFNIQYLDLKDRKEDLINAYAEVCSYYPGKIREIIINGTKKRAIFNDEAMIKLSTINRETEEIELFNVQNSITPLEKQCKHFFDTITQNSKKPMTDVYDGFKNVKMLETLNKMLWIN